MKKPPFRPIGLLLALALLLVALAGAPARAQAPSVHLALGNPSGAASDPAQPDNYLIVRGGYALAYQRDRGTPRWVSWHLEAADITDAVDRYQGQFKTDVSLPAGWPRVIHDDYNNTDYDRGHMTPSADRTATQTANEETFLMTNVVPQAPANNRGPWAQLEDHTRDLVDAGAEAYIITGPLGAQGTIAAGKVTVPEAVWKVIVALPAGDDDLSRIGAGSTVIAVLMPNDASVQGWAWQSFQTSVACLQQRLGIDLLSALDPSVQLALEGPGCPAAAVATVYLPIISAGAGQGPAPEPQPDVKIVEVVNPPGVPLDEYVLIRNEGAAAAAMEGWTLSDAAETEFTFPSFSLAPGAQVRVWVKAGTNDGENLYWGRGSPVWNNTGGDTATLRDAAGRLVSEYSYE
jgi:endonuclease G